MPAPGLRLFGPPARRLVVALCSSQCALCICGYVNAAAAAVYVYALQLGYYGFREQQALKQALLERQQELEQSELVMVDQQQQRQQPPAAAVSGHAPMSCTATCFERSRSARLANVLSTGLLTALPAAVCSAAAARVSGCIFCCFVAAHQSTCMWRRSRCGRPWSRSFSRSC